MQEVYQINSDCTILGNSNLGLCTVSGVTLHLNNNKSKIMFI